MPYMGVLLFGISIHSLPLALANTVSNVAKANISFTFIIRQLKQKAMDTNYFPSKDIKKGLPPNL